MNKYNSRQNSGPIEACGPSIKDLKLSLKELDIALAELHELQEAGYIDYQVETQVFGNLYLRRRGLARELKQAKANKKS